MRGRTPSAPGGARPPSGAEAEAEAEEAEAPSSPSQSDSGSLPEGLIRDLSVSGLIRDKARCKLFAGRVLAESTALASSQSASCEADGLHSRRRRAGSPVRLSRSLSHPVARAACSHDREVAKPGRGGGRRTAGNRTRGAGWPARASPGLRKCAARSQKSFFQQLGCSKREHFHRKLPLKTCWKPDEGKL